MIFKSSHMHQKKHRGVLALETASDVNLIFLSFCITYCLTHMNCLDNGQILLSLPYTRQYVNS